MSAILSSDGRYRYQLERFVSPTGGRLLWVMLNPSTADAETDDPTIRRVMGFTRRWGYGAARVVNLFGFRATDPADLAAFVETQGLSAAVGPENDDHIAASLCECVAVVEAWGAKPETWPWSDGRVRTVVRLIRASGLPTLIVGRTKNGNPRHPLMAAYGPAVIATELHGEAPRSTERTP